jgi:GT2 family glycosyltransferase
MKNDEPVIAVALLYHTKHDGVLEKVLKGIERLDYPKSKIHLLLIDNFSTDGAYEIVESWINKNREGYFSVDHDRLLGNVPHLRNICLEKAMKKGCEYIFFVDSDVILVPDAIKRLIKIFNTYEKVFAASLPYFVPLEKDTIFVRIRAKYGKGALKHFKIVGYFDEEIPYIEDLNLTRRATNMGFKIIVDPQVKLLHDKSMNTLQWLKMILKIGKSEVKNMIRVGTWKNELKSLLYWFLLLISIPLTIVQPAFFMFFILLLSFGWIVYATRFEGMGKIIGFPIMAVYRITRLIGIIFGLILCVLEVVRK